MLARPSHPGGGWSRPRRTNTRRHRLVVVFGDREAPPAVRPVAAPQGRIQEYPDLDRSVGSALVDDEVLAECIRTLRLEAIDESMLLSRRHRWKPLAMDLHDGGGAVLVARRGKRARLTITAFCFDLDAVPPALMHLAAGTHRELPVLPPRTSIAQWGGGPLMSRSLSGSGTGWWCMCAQLKLEAHSWRLRGVTRPVAPHGWIVAIGRDHHRPSIRVFDEGDNSLGVVSTRRWYRRSRWVHRSFEGGWFNYRSL